MDFKILTNSLLDDYAKAVKESPSHKIDKIKKLDMPFDYFQFYKSVSSAYSSKIISILTANSNINSYRSNLSLDFLLMTLKGIDNHR